MTAAAPVPGRFAGDVPWMFRCGSPCTGRTGTNRERTRAARFREPVDEAALAGEARSGDCGRERRIEKFAQVRRPAAKPLAGRVGYKGAVPPGSEGNAEFHTNTARC